LLALRALTINQPAGRTMPSYLAERSAVTRVINEQRALFRLIAFADNHHRTPPVCALRDRTLFTMAT